MTKQIISKLAAALRITAAVFLTFLLGSFFPAAVSGVNAQTVRKETSSSQGGPKEGIKVHGHWTIEVRNPDGKLVTHREFENGLSSTAPLAALLGRTKTVGAWAIKLFSNGSQELCFSADAGSLPCLIQESSFPANGQDLWNTLTFSLPVSGLDANAFILNGITTAGSGPNYIRYVETYLRVCDANITSLACGTSQSATSYRFTSTSIPEPNWVPVVKGQIIQVTVKITFS